jgi:hypothetical protein
MSKTVATRNQNQLNQIKEDENQIRIKLISKLDMISEKLQKLTNDQAKQMNMKIGINNMYY